MTNIDFHQLVVVVVWVVIFVFGMRARHISLALLAGFSALVLKEKPFINQALFLNENPVNTNTKGSVYVRLVGRKGGLFAWLFALLGIDRTVTFTVYGRHIEYTESTLFGHVTNTYPLTTVSSFGSAYLKPVLYLVAAIASLIVSLCSFAKIYQWSVSYAFLSLCVGVAVSVGLGILYFLNKCTCIYAISNAGTGPRIFLKRSVIEGHSLSEAEAGVIVTFITSLIEENQKHT